MKSWMKIQQAEWFFLASQKKIYNENDCCRYKSSIFSFIGLYWLTPFNLLTMARPHIEHMNAAQGKACVRGILERLEGERMELRIDGEKRKNERQTGELINFSLIKPDSQGTSFISSSIQVQTHAN